MSTAPDDPALQTSAPVTAAPPRPWIIRLLSRIVRLLSRMVRFLARTVRLLSRMVRFLSRTVRLKPPVIILVLSALFGALLAVVSLHFEKQVGDRIDVTFRELALTTAAGLAFAVEPEGLNGLIADFRASHVGGVSVQPCPADGDPKGCEVPILPGQMIQLSLTADGARPIFKPAIRPRSAPTCRVLIAVSDTTRSDLTLRLPSCAAEITLEAPAPAPANAPAIAPTPTPTNANAIAIGTLHFEDDSDRTTATAGSPPPRPLPLRCARTPNGNEPCRFTIRATGSMAPNVAPLEVVFDLDKGKRGVLLRAERSTSPPAVASLDGTLSAQKAGSSYYWQCCAHPGDHLGLDGPELRELGVDEGGAGLTATLNRNDSLVSCTWDKSGFLLRSVPTTGGIFGALMALFAIGSKKRARVKAQSPPLPLAQQPPPPPPPPFPSSPSNSTVG